MYILKTIQSAHLFKIDAHQNILIYRPFGISEDDGGQEVLHGRRVKQKLSDLRLAAVIEPDEITGIVQHQWFSICRAYVGKAGGFVQSGDSDLVGLEGVVPDTEYRKLRFPPVYGRLPRREQLLVVAQVGMQQRVSYSEYSWCPDRSSAA